MIVNFNFKEFLEARGAVGGAFGKFGKQKSRYNVMGGPIDDTADYKSRIQAGKSIEEQIRNKMDEELGLIAKPATSAQDKYEGIDAWIIGNRNENSKTSIPIQIKARKHTSGNDILWEAVKPWNKQLISSFENSGNQVFTGKDMKSKAHYLISISNDGSTIRMRYVSEIIDAAKKMVEAFIQNIRATGRTNASTQWGEIRLVKDPSKEANYRMSGDVFKLNCFIRPDALEWKRDFQLKSPIGVV
jgi:hypothetical protein